ncbi:MAG: hypothetical protein PUE72_03280 [Lachnospiraceae bacterium]|nr:hypothetical protein [Lachnospiraceae bacterium]
MKKCTNIFKTLFSTMLIGTVAFSTVFTLNVEKAYAEANISGLEDDSVGSWENTEVVDEFGDATGESAIRSVVSGTFSNTATAESNLTVVASITMGVPAYSSDFISDNATLIRNTLTYPTSAYNVQFRLLEYDKTPATHLKSDNMILKTKVGEDVEEYILIGNEDNSDLLVNPVIMGVTGFERNGELLLKDLYEGNDVRCIVEIGSSKYKFTLEAGNFQKIIDENNLEKPLDAEGQEQRFKDQKADAHLEKAESVIKSKTDFIAAYVNHADADNNYESGYYYFNGHADEFEDLTEEELSAIFPCRFRYYLVNPVLAGTPGAGDLYEYDADGNTKQLGRFGTDDSYRTREEINPNWPEINGSWRIENGELIRTVAPAKAENKYKVKSLDHDGYYLLCGASGNGPAMMIVLYDENNMPLHEFTEE